jgi:ubiquinone/menaquinone biosynthesis C-methylase UbiE
MLGVKSGMTVIDVGAGTGFFARSAARLTGPEGRVFAADISEEMVREMRAFENPGHLIPLHSAEYSVPLPDATADFVLAAFVLHETPDRRRFLGELLRLAKVGGRVVLLEWRKQTEEEGPPREERLSEDELDHDLAECQVQSRGVLNSSHYYRIVQKS